MVVENASCSRNISADGRGGVCTVPCLNNKPDTPLALANVAARLVN